MKRVEVPSYPVSIFIAGDTDQANVLCRQYCDAHGLCVTLTATDYIYTQGQEGGVIVGLINYPRFPKEPKEIWAQAPGLGDLPCGRTEAGKLHDPSARQNRVVQLAQGGSGMIASADTLPKGRDAQQGSVGTKGSAVPKADAPNTLIKSLKRGRGK